MSINEIHNSFKVELDKSNISGYPSFLPEEIDYFFNLEVKRFYKTRYSGNNAFLKGFQGNQKRSDDLRLIVKRKNAVLYGVTNGWNYSLYEYEYPDDYWFSVGETVDVSSLNINWPTDKDGNFIRIKSDVIESTIENIDSRINNTLSDHVFRGQRVRPLRVYVDGKIDLYTDGTYEIDNYIISYISKPAEIDYYLGDNDIDLKILPDHAYDEVISMAVKSAIENISDYRYQTYSQEIQSAE